MDRAKLHFTSSATGENSPKGAVPSVSGMASSPTETEKPAAGEMEFDLSDMEPWREYAVILYNDDVHSAEEVVIQLVKALGCPVGRAHEIMLTAHRTGQATVAIAGRERAMRIASVLRQIDLKVTLRQIN